MLLESVAHRHYKIQRSLALAIQLTLLTFSTAIFCATTFAAQQQDTLRSYHIPAGVLATQLNRFAQEAGIFIAADAQLTNGKASAGLQGNYSIATGLAALLKDTDLDVIAKADGSYSVKPSVKKLTKIKVTADSITENPTAPLAGYVASQSLTATKTNTAIAETPQSISVITRDRMDAQAVQTAEQALRYTAGVLTEVTGYDLRYQAMNIRGFDTASYRDGLRTFAAGSYADWVAEPQGLERVEVLKGPASVLYGQAAPGGIVNQIAKRPSLDAIQQVGISVGSNQRYQATLDAGGKINADDNLLFRVNGLARDSNTQTDYSQDDRLFFAPSLLCNISEQTSLTLLGDITQDRVTPKSWWPDKALLDDNPNGKIPVSRYAGEPDFDHYNRDMNSLAYLLEHQFNDIWTLRQTARYSHFKLDYQHVYGDSWQDDQRTINRGTLVSYTNGNAFTVDNQIAAKFDNENINHKIVLGIDYQQFAGHENLGFGEAPSLDVFAPVYDAAVVLPDTDKYHSDLDQSGIYAQDQMRSGQWIINIGLRHDKANTTNRDDSGSLKQDDNKTTYNTGLLYLVENGFSPYVSFSTSFSPSINTTFDGTPFEPETGKQIESGIKYQPKDMNSLWTLSLFDLHKQHVTTDDPINEGYSIQTGEVRARGIELETVAALTHQLNLVASYTYLDAEVTRSNDATELGKQPRQSTKNAASLWLDYYCNETGNGLSGSAGIRYVDKVAADAGNTYFNPGYTLVDAALRYKTGSTSFALNAANLFDKIYVANRAQFYGQGRALQGSVTYQW